MLILAINNEIPAVYGSAIRQTFLSPSTEANSSGASSEGSGVNLQLSGLKEEESATYSKADIIGASSEFTEDEQRQIRELKNRDREVRQHEQTHAAMLGRYASGGPVYEYQIGPDGKAYAVGGSVEADVGEESTPEETIAKAQILRMAATGVNDASSADMSIAGKAALMEAQARTEFTA